MNMDGNHWVLGIYTRESHTIRYYNTMWAPLRTDTRQALIAAVKEFYPNCPDPTIRITPRWEYNQQRDGYNCGPHCCLIFERYVMGDSTMIRPLSLEHERQRMLSNLIAAYIADDMPYLPLHPNGEQYIPFAQYLLQINYYGTAIEVVASDNRLDRHATAIVDDQDDQLIHYWRGNGQEVDPPTAELSPSDLQAFYSSDELGPHRNEIAKEICQLCGTSIVHISAFADNISAIPNTNQNLTVISLTLCYACSPTYAGSKQLSFEPRSVQSTIPCPIQGVNSELAITPTVIHPMPT